MEEVEVLFEDKIYNLTQILKNNADFEQLKLSKQEANSYAAFLIKDAMHKPEFMVAGKTVFPSENDYADRDPEEDYKQLSYGEKLAITLYSGDKIYDKVNKFLRYNGMDKDSQSSSSAELTKNVKEALLVSSIATKALMKLNKIEKPNTVSTGVVAAPVPVTEELHRVESPSRMHLQRQLDIQAGRVTKQKGFTSTSTSPDITTKMKLRDDSVHLVINLPKDSKINLGIAKLAWDGQEHEKLFPPGTEFKYYLQMQKEKTDVLHGFPVRTITYDTQYAYGTEPLRALRHEALKFIQSIVGVHFNITLDNVAYVFAWYKNWLNVIDVTSDELNFLQDILAYIKSSSGKNFTLTRDDITRMKIDPFDVSFLLNTVKFDDYPVATKRILKSTGNLDQIIIDSLAPDQFSLLNPASKRKLLLSAMIDISDPNKTVKLIADLFTASLITNDDLLSVIQYVDQHASHQMRIIAIIIHSIFLNQKNTITNKALTFVDSAGLRFQTEIYLSAIFYNNIRLANLLSGHLPRLAINHEIASNISTEILIALKRNDIKKIVFQRSLDILKSDMNAVNSYLLSFITDNKGAFQSDIDLIKPRLITIIEGSHKQNSSDRSVQLRTFISLLLMKQKADNKTSSSQVNTLFPGKDSAQIKQLRSQVIDKLLANFVEGDKVFTPSDVQVLMSDQSISSLINQYRHLLPESFLKVEVDLSEAGKLEVGKTPPV